MEQVSKLRKSRKTLHQNVKKLIDRLDKRKDENMNRTLYALTLVTTIATPLAVTSGVFGMNFTDMHELVALLPPCIQPSNNLPSPSPSPVPFSCLSSCLARCSQSPLVRGSKHL